ncbi:MAG: hypothetical protein EYC68_00825 [Chloroflexota bacterium]|nr:MAG: hypothetical protein EYC68_00825 [Chloroflexota bacterium]
MIRVTPDHIVPLEQARRRLDEILQSAAGNQIWLIAEDEIPKVAIVNAQFFEQILRRLWFDELAAKSQDAFRNHLIQLGLNPDELAEDEIESILQK